MIYNIYDMYHIWTAQPAGGAGGLGSDPPCGSGRRRPALKEVLGLRGCAD